MARIHPSSIKASNVASSNAWLTRGFEGTGAEPADQLALARGAQDRKARKRTALLVREADVPISETVEAMVQMLRMGRMRVEDVEATQIGERDRLKSLRALQGSPTEIARLEALVNVRQEVLDRIHRDPFAMVVSPVRTVMHNRLTEFNQCHSPEDGKFCSAPESVGAGGLGRDPGGEEGRLAQAYNKALRRGDARSDMSRDVANNPLHETLGAHGFVLRSVRQQPSQSTPELASADSVHYQYTGHGARVDVRVRRDGDTQFQFFPSGQSIPKVGATTAKLAKVLAHEYGMGGLTQAKRVVTVRPKVYRGEQGFSVRGYRPGEPMWQPHVFTKTRSSAERIRAKLRRGEEIGPEDFRL